MGELENLNNYMIEELNDLQEFVRDVREADEVIFISFFF
jgi:hypothetical protein